MMEKKVEFDSETIERSRRSTMKDVRDSIRQSGRGKSVKYDHYALIPDGPRDMTLRVYYRVDGLLQVANCAM